MIAIFYDRKNKREVTSEQLQGTNYVETYAVGDDDDEYIPTGRKTCPGTFESFTREQFDRALAEGHFNQRIFDMAEPDDGITWEKMKDEMTPRVLYLRERQIADLHYKSENCPSHLNGDLHCMTSDLIFLRLGS